jgi:hypothetical protein
MNRSRVLAARPAALASVAAAAALLLSGCHSSSSAASGGSGNSPSAGSSGHSTASNSGSSSAGSGNSVTSAAYYPVGVGYTWVYKESGFGGGTSTEKVLSVTPSSAGQVATMSSTISKPAKTVSKATLIFRPDGSIEVPLTQFENMGVTVESGTVLWPSAAQLASGAPYHNTIVMKLDEAGQHMTLRMPITVKGSGTSSVTVPAGTYQASDITETMTSSIDGYKFSMAVETWVANGVGPVKSEVFSSMLGGTSSKPASTQELLSFTK